MKNDNNESLSIFWTILSNALPPIGFFLYFKHRNQFPVKAQKAITNALIGIPVGLIGGYVLQNYIL